MNKIELSNGLSPESVSLYRDLCLEGTIIELYAQSGKLFSKGRYKESREMLEELRKIIIVNAEKLGTGKSELNNFFETVISEFQNTYSVDNISLEEIKPLRVKFQQMAKEIFPNKFGKEYSEILVDVLLMPSICKAFEKSTPERRCVLMLCKTKTCDDVKITQESLEKELVYTKMYLKILDDWYGNLLKKSNSFRENSPTLLEVLGEGVRSSLISSMCNIFTGSNEASLWRLIDQVEKTTGRVENKESYIKRIEEIHGKLNPLRNVERNHTIPWRKDKDKKFLCPK